MTMTSIESHISGSQHRSALSRVANLQVFWVFLAAVIACVALSFMTDAFATERNLFNVARNFAFVAIIAIGMTAVIASGGIDLSVGSTVVLSAMVISVLMEAGNPFWLSAAAALGAALLVGMINGVLIAYAGMPAFVVTLGMLSAARSLAMVLSNNKMIWEFGPDHDLLLWIGGGSTLGLPHPLYVLVALDRHHLRLPLDPLGPAPLRDRRQRTGGADDRHPVKAIKVSIYMFSAFTAGLTGILMAGWLGSVTTNLGQSMELAVIAAAVIGGANLAGGEGSPLGAVVGALLIEVIRNSLILLGISTFWQGMFIGTFIVIAVAFDRVRHLRS
jgi:ribose transport system permease protein